MKNLYKLYKKSSIGNEGLYKHISYGARGTRLLYYYIYYIFMYRCL